VRGLQEVHDEPSGATDEDNLLVRFVQQPARSVDTIVCLLYSVNILRC